MLPYTLAQLPHIAQQLIQQYAQLPIWLFDAPMGVGKTNLIKEISKQLLVIDEVSSPTYPIVNEYHTQSGQIIFHIDLYRLSKLDEALQIGIEDYLYPDNGYCFIEWHQLINPILPKPLLLIEIEQLPNNLRQIKTTVQKHLLK